MIELTGSGAVVHSSDPVDARRDAAWVVRLPCSVRICRTCLIFLALTPDDQVSLDWSLAGSWSVLMEADSWLQETRSLVSSASARLHVEWPAGTDWYPDFQSTD